MIFNLKEISNNLNKFEINQSDDAFQNEEMDGYLSPSPDYMQLSSEQKISPKNANQPTPSSSNTSVTNLIQQYESSTTSAVTAANKIRLNSSEEEEEESTIYSFYFYYFFFLIIKFLLKKTI
jgi:hypothetical protein